jgi:uncharacterized small protein (DUF1192 family)
MGGMQNESQAVIIANLTNEIERLRARIERQ